MACLPEVFLCLDFQRNDLQGKETRIKEER